MQLANETTIRLDQGSVLTLRDSVGTGQLVDAIRGAFHFISRTRKPFGIATPLVNASVEGTEFLVRVERERVELLVFEGRLAARNAEGSVVIKSGGLAVVDPGKPPRSEFPISPKDAVQWTLFYPPLFSYRSEERIRGATGDALRDAIDQSRAGKLGSAIERLEAPDARSNPAALIYLANLLLQVGRVDEARAEVEDALVVDPLAGDAYAVRSIIDVVQNHPQEALLSASRATELNPTSLSAALALSYAQEANFRIEEAQRSALKATQLAPTEGLPWARLAEMYIAQGEVARGRQAAARAVALDPDLAKTQTALGFASLATGNTSAARVAFEKAINLDQADPVPWLGRGLAQIRQGNLEAGRSAIEVSACLDSEDSLIRTYLGKAYFEEARNLAARKQFDLAKELDPRDPTPWFYSAILNDTETKPIEALAELNNALALNDNRAVYRSRLLLDRDQAARGVGLAAVYNELGFSQLGNDRAAASLASDPASAAAHRFLADIDATLPRREVARGSELLQAQLLQPYGAASLQPQLANDFLLKDNFLGPAVVGVNEFNSLFARDRATGQFFANAGVPRMGGEQLVGSLLDGPLFYSVSETSLYDRGYRENNDQRRRQLDGFVQARLSSEASVQLEVTDEKRVSGDLSGNFSPLDIQSNFRSTDSFSTYRLGGRISPDGVSDWLFSLTHQREQQIQAANDASAFVASGVISSSKVELQSLRRYGSLRTVMGASYFHSQTTVVASAIGFAPPPDAEAPEETMLYGYLYLASPQHLPQLQMGFSLDHFRSHVGNQRQVDPKFGFTWQPIDALTFHGAAYKVLKRNITPNLEQDLEPTQIAGFAQFADDLSGTVATSFNIGASSSLAERLHFGVNLLHRSLQVPVGLGDVTFEHWRERGVDGYTYVLLGTRGALAFQPREQYFDGGGAFSQLKTTEYPLSLRLFLPSQVWLAATATFVRQRVVQADSITGADVQRSSHFGVVDAQLNYRLPLRYGTVGFIAKNIFNRKFNYQEADVDVVPRYIPSRQVRVTVSILL